MKLSIKYMPGDPFKGSQSKVSKTGVTIKRDDIKNLHETHLISVSI